MPTSHCWELASQLDVRIRWCEWGQGVGWHPIMSSPRLDGQITAWMSPFPLHVPLNVSPTSVISVRLKEYLDCTTISSISALWLWYMLWRSLMNTSLSHDFPAPCCFWAFVHLMNPFGVTEATAAEQLISYCDWYISLNRNPCSASHFNLFGSERFWRRNICMCMILNSQAVCQSFSKDETCLFCIFISLIHFFFLALWGETCGITSDHFGNLMNVLICVQFICICFWTKWFPRFTLITPLHH